MKNGTDNYTIPDVRGFLIGYPLKDSGIDIIPISQMAVYWKIEKRKIKFYVHNSINGCKEIPENCGYVKVDSEKHCYNISRALDWKYMKD